ncbi:kinetochore complex Sim4 subunit Fta1-domain-containing protein [Diplogelasinospora grovesii]|uniref:Kinetochore complex Sim4 subunit Fta1-domain-containing protein n=1 Tax=Diplogelasinospora grovesii TaxID=303347 RepID=A0AAN6N1D0_9PEZI|nr:kinetochore complex Sim4 subunit Fta1-domain-containing protein [Diplogelasinospora grovesii]
MASRRRQARRKEPERAAAISPDRESSAARSAESSSLSEPSPPFYNTTFSTHRVSPLYLGKEPLTDRRLETLAQRLRETLVGDVVRGVEVGMGGGEDAVMGRAGALEAVEVRWVRMTSILDIRSGRAGRPESRDLGSDAVEANTSSEWQRTVARLRRRNALHISLRYESALCTGVLLPSLSGDEDNGDLADAQNARLSMATSQDAQPPSIAAQRFLTMPLLLLRMTAPLKNVIIDFLSTAFDCRISPLRLGTRSMVHSWESWVGSAGLPSRGPHTKDVVLSLGFHLTRLNGLTTADGSDAAADTGLKSIDVIIPAGELGKFVEAGTELARSSRSLPVQTKRKAAAEWEEDSKKRRNLAGRLREEGWEWQKSVAAVSSDEPDSDAFNQPFVDAVGHYVDKHLGLNLFHPGVRIIKIACGGFVMSEGRLKIFAPADLGDVDAGDDYTTPGHRGAISELLRNLVDRASIRGIK